ncbi:hypothetical protein HOLleu_00559 [Holothuria leucospilota]|uniref:Uncharacterized protein n=1 Tax=Holothuria leucospilota TaxID=206669 RepID=A0A9Q1CMF0_HOLLE|nr:hypothetical protein HOLleu_00559 [Holothuria leucospilota]
MSLKGILPSGAVLSVLGFSENYKRAFQREVQSAYYSQDAVTIHPIVYYYHCSQCKKEVTESCIMVSDDLHLVHAFQQAVFLIIFCLQGN